MHRRTVWWLLWQLAYLLRTTAHAGPDEGWNVVLRRHDPSQKPSGLTRVRVSIYVRNVRHVDDDGQTYGVQITFRQQWNDPRLTHKEDSSSAYSLYRLTNLTSVWRPDTFFSNEVDGTLHSLTRDNAFVRVTADGDVLMSERLSLTLACPMNLRMFPFDRHTCAVRMLSYGYTTNMVEYLWRDVDPMQVSKRYLPADFQLGEFGSSYCTARTNTGDYSCIFAEIELRRLWWPYVSQVFLPLTMLCGVAWLTLWIPHTQMRATALMFTFSVAAISVHALTESFPKTGYVKMADYFTWAALAFILAAVVELVAVMWLNQQNKNDTAHRTDSRFRLVYPAVYAVFTLIYWLVVISA